MEFTLRTKIMAKAKDIYSAWLDSDAHTDMTGGKATASTKEGDDFTAWEGYISGKNIKLEPDKRIVQSWRTTQFLPEQEDSQIEVLLEEQNGETELTLIHSNLTDVDDHYKAGWEEHYFQPMKDYFKR